MIGTIGVGGQTGTNSNFAELTIEYRELASKLTMELTMRLQKIMNAIAMNAIVIH
jgi:hypothetical protein